jgi:hypothetical protein
MGARMTADLILSKLHRVKATGPSRWAARCPAHDDRSPSLSVRELDDGRLLIHDHGGCSVQDVLSAVGLTFSDLFPPHQPRLTGHRPERRPWLPSDLFQVLLHEATIVSVIGADLHKNRSVSETDYERLMVAIGRLNGIARVYGH